MSTHAGALLLAALAYSFARSYAHDSRFSFGTGKLGDLAGFTGAIVLAMFALLTGYEAVTRLFAPVPIHFAEAIPIACLGLAVNIASVWLLSGGHHHHGNGHDEHDHDAEHRIETPGGGVALSVFEADHSRAAHPVPVAGAHHGRGRAPAGVRGLPDVAECSIVRASMVPRERVKRERRALWLDRGPGASRRLTPQLSAVRRWSVRPVGVGH